MKYLIIPALAGTLVLAGCAELLRTTAPTVTPVENQAAIVVKTQVVAGGYRTEAVPRLTVSSINHLVLQIFELDGEQENPILDAEGNEVSHDLTRANLGSLITFSKLRAQTRYRIRAYAYKAPGTDPADLISTTDANSYTDVNVQEDDRPTVTTLKVKLLDVDFDGQATFNGVNVTAGGYRSTGPVGISVIPAAALLNEGQPAEQGMLDIYLPNFANGMRWTYRIVTTVAAVDTTQTLVQEISNVSEAGFTLTETATASNAPEPQTTVRAMTPAQWFPPASELRDMGYDTVTVLAGTFGGDTTKFAAAGNTATDRQYYWITGNGGLVLREHAFRNEQGQDVTVRQELVSVSP